MTEQANEAGFHWPDDNADREPREAQLPEHEQDSTTSIGGGVASAAGTAGEGWDSTAGAQGTKRDDFPGDGVDPDLGLMNEEDQPVLNEPGLFQMGGKSG